MPPVCACLIATVATACGAPDEASSPQGASPIAGTEIEPTPTSITESVTTSTTTTTAVPATSEQRRETPRFLSADWAQADSPVLAFIGLPEGGQTAFLELSRVHETRISECMANRGFEYIPQIGQESADAYDLQQEQMSVDERIAFDDALYGFGDDAEPGCFETSQVEVFPMQALYDEMDAAVHLVSKCRTDLASDESCELFEPLLEQSLISSPEGLQKATEIVMIEQNYYALLEYRDSITSAMEEVSQ